MDVGSCAHHCFVLGVRDCSEGLHGVTKAHVLKSMLLLLLLLPLLLLLLLLMMMMSQLLMRILVLLPRCSSHNMV